LHNFSHDAGGCLSPRSDENVCCYDGKYWSGAACEDDKGFRSSQGYGTCDDIAKSIGNSVNQLWLCDYAQDYRTQMMARDACCACGKRRSTPVKGFCHDPSQPSVQYSRYTTCESACKRNGNDFEDYYGVCKDPSTGGRKDVMTQMPANSVAANKKMWCVCVERCLQCTGEYGGIGERPVGIAANLNPDYASIHGTCAPPPDSWYRPSTGNSQPATPSPSTGNPVPVATDYTCAADNNQGTILCALLQPRYSPVRIASMCRPDE
jgi:hypothetical protein